MKPTYHARRGGCWDTWRRHVSHRDLPRESFVLQTRHTPPLVWPEKLIDAHLKFGGWESLDGEPSPILREAEQATPVNPRNQELFDRGFTRVQPPKGTVKIIVGRSPRRWQPRNEGKATSSSPTEPSPGPSRPCPASGSRVCRGQPLEVEWRRVGDDANRKRCRGGVRAPRDLQGVPVS